MFCLSILCLFYIFAFLCFVVLCFVIDPWSAHAQANGGPIFPGTFLDLKTAFWLSFYYFLHCIILFLHCRALLI